MSTANNQVNPGLQPEMPNDPADGVDVSEESEFKLQFSPNQVEEFLQSLPRVKVKTSSLIKKEEDRICSICLFEYGEFRGCLAAAAVAPVAPPEVVMSGGKGKRKLSPTSVSTDESGDDDQGLPGEELPESATKLPCGHIYGDWCIKTWLLAHPATCPECRFRFRPF